MRYTGGLPGGSWLTALTSDLGNGKFDGGYLVENFENLNPANTLWTKQYNLWSKVDTEGERFLEFEKWWGGHVTSTRRRSSGSSISCSSATSWPPAKSSPATVTGSTCATSVRRSSVSAPRATTSPRRSRRWAGSSTSTRKDDDIRAYGQTIVYAIHENIGHLGIFVSGGIAQKEHQEFASNIDLIDVLPPGLYEAVMTRDRQQQPADLVTGDWIVRFEPRTLDDVRAIVQPDPRTSAALPPCDGFRRSTWVCIAPCSSRWSRRPSMIRPAEWMKKLDHSELPL